MISRLKIVALGFFAWVLFFLAARAFFMLYQFEATAQLDFMDILLAFVHGIRMDMAMAGYFSLLPGLILGLLFFCLWKGNLEVLVSLPGDTHCDLCIYSCTGCRVVRSLGIQVGCNPHTILW